VFVVFVRGGSTAVVAAISDFFDVIKTKFNTSKSATAKKIQMIKDMLADNGNSTAIPSVA
jgi:hypothetical protein